MHMDLALSIGSDRSPEARAIFHKYRSRYGPESWGAQYFERGIDTDPVTEPPPGDEIPLDDTDSVLPGTPEYNARALGSVSRSSGAS